MLLASAVSIGAQPVIKGNGPIAPTLLLPSREGSLKLAVIGDAGRGNVEQRELGDLMAEYHRAFPFGMVLMTGDNIYGSDSAEAMRKKFELPYKRLLDAGVMFQASLGNHDSNEQLVYPLFNMNGRSFYRLDAAGVSIYALDSNRLNDEQLNWLSAELRADPNPWRIAFFHHPPFSSGSRHGSDMHARRLLHPVFVANRVDVVFNGHDHFYERLVPQDGVNYFVSGAGGKIRNGDLKDGSPMTAKGYDKDLSFMLVEITGDQMHFQVVARSGQTVDSGTIRRRN